MRDHRPDTPFAARLRRAADDLSPPFSPAVHAAVMRRVRRAVPSPAARPAARWVSLVATVAVAVGIGLLVARRPAPPRRMARTPVVPSLPAWPAVDPWPTVGYAGLDRDAGRAARFLIAQLDAVPTPTGRPPTSKPAAAARLGT